MNLQEYKALALRSIKPHTDKHAAICDWCLGLSGETAEVLDIFTESFERAPQGTLWEDDSRMELAKELGDILWYTVAAAAELGVEHKADFADYVAAVPLGERKNISVVYECLQLAVEVGYLAENVKHYVMHGEDLKADLAIQALDHIWQYLHLLAIAQGFTLVDIAELNVAKLAHRYNLKEGGQFNVEASAQRHEQEAIFTDTEEYKILRQRIIGEL